LVEGGGGEEKRENERNTRREREEGLVSATGPKNHECAIVGCCTTETTSTVSWPNVLAVRIGGGQSTDVTDANFLPKFQNPLAVDFFRINCFIDRFTISALVNRHAEIYILF
jgi:hypothetical protein